MWRNLRIALILAVFGVGSVVERGHAQDLGARARDAVEQTERRIEQAEGVVTDAADPSAQAELSLARDLQVRARSALAGSQWLLATRLTLEARSHADRAIAIVRGLPDPDRVASQLERTREVLDRWQGEISACEEERARALLRVASEMQVRAEAALRDSRYLAALQLTKSARERVFRALRLCRIEESAQENASRGLERTNDVLVRARETISGSGHESSQQLLGRAEAVQAEATSEFKSGRFESSLRLTQNARALAHRATRLAARGPGSKPGR